ncbi:hypothetical protein GM421_05010 [Lactobacillus delbrueckii]|nr:hypothetical protein GM421_05010 [Lactobacillus delbrueckii]
MSGKTAAPPLLSPPLFVKGNLNNLLKRGFCKETLSDSVDKVTSDNKSSRVN